MPSIGGGGRTGGIRNNGVQSAGHTVQWFYVLEQKISRTGGMEVLVLNTDFGDSWLGNR